MSNEPLASQLSSFPSHSTTSQSASLFITSDIVNTNESQFEPAQNVPLYLNNIFSNASISTASNHSTIPFRSTNSVISWERIPSPKLGSQDTNTFDEASFMLATSNSFSNAPSMDSSSNSFNVVDNQSQPNQFLFSNFKTPIISFIEESGKPLQRSTTSESSREEYSSQDENQKRKTNLACDSCRKTHRKCYLEHGDPPCKLCIKKGIECTFEMRKKKPEISKQKEFIMEAHGKKRKTTDTTTSVNTSLQSIKKSKAESPSTHFNKSNSPTTSSSPEHTAIVPTTSIVNYASPETAISTSSAPDRNYFYLTSMISQFVRNYERFIHPDHSVLPISTDNFIGIVPDLVNNMFGTPSKQEKEDLFLLNCILANSANAMGDLARAKDFSLKAREYVGLLFDVFDPRVAGAFVLFSYLNFGWCNLDKAAYYAKIAMTNYEMQSKMIEPSSSAAIILDKNDLHLNCIVAVAYTMITFEDKMDYFNKLLNNGTRKIDAIWAIVGQCEAYLDYGRVTNWDSLVGYLFQALSLINISDPNEHVTMLHELLVYSVLARALNVMDTNSDLEAKLNNRKLALQWAIKALEILLKPTGKFLCVGVICNAASSIGEVFILNHDWNRYQILYNFLHTLSLNLPLVNMYIDILQKKYDNEQKFLQLPQNSSILISQQSQQTLL